MKVVLVHDATRRHGDDLMRRLPLAATSWTRTMTGVPPSKVMRKKALRGVALLTEGPNLRMLASLRLPSSRFSCLSRPRWRRA